MFNADERTTLGIIQGFSRSVLGIVSDIAKKVTKRRREVFTFQTRLNREVTFQTKLMTEEI